MKEIVIGQCWAFWYKGYYMERFYVSNQTYNDLMNAFDSAGSHLGLIHLITHKLSAREVVFKEDKVIFSHGGYTFSGVITFYEHKAWESTIETD